MAEGQTVLVSKIGPTPIHDVKIKKETISRLTGDRREVSYDIILQMTHHGNTDTLICDLSFKVSNCYAQKEYYTVIQTKEQALELTQRTLDTLKQYDAVIPNIKSLYADRENDMFEHVLKAAVVDLEDTFTVEEKHIGIYLNLIRCITELSIAFSTGDLVPTSNSYIPGYDFQESASSLLYVSLYRLIT